MQFDAISKFIVVIERLSSSHRFQNVSPTSQLSSIDSTSQSMASKRNVQRVEFKTIDGTVLRGDLYAVENDNAPMIVMTQGVRLGP